MITVISPAKKLSKECFAYSSDHTKPELLSESSTLVEGLKNLEPAALRGLMGISENLSILNWERYQSWNLPFKESNSRQAFFVFQGDTYKGLDAESLTKNDLSFAQNHTRILSGLYGMLRPLDLIMPYRLEMSTKLKNKFGKNLYDFWSDKLSKSINKEIESHAEKSIINCASLEYFKSIDSKSLNAKIVTPLFKEIKSGKVKMVSFYAKKARGMMARYIIKNKINNVDDIMKFDLGGYSYNHSLSTILEPVFTRVQA